MKKTSDKFNQLLHGYLTVFLPKQRNSSPHTVLAAKQVWNMLLNHVCTTVGKRVETLTFVDIDCSAVLEFLDSKEEEKNWASTTRNHRLGVIRSFFRYVVGIEPTMSYHLEALNKIPLKKVRNKSFILEYMSQESITALICQPDTSKKMGIRDTFFMSLMYDTAARDSELLSMDLHHLDPIGKTVYLIGKGNKPRLVSIDDNTISQFHLYVRLYHPTGEGTRPMFYTIRNGNVGRMSDDNVARFIKKYGGEARRHCPEVPEQISPHKIRRSRAMHMYQGGMPLEVVSLILGHEDPQTTWIYAKADLEMKRKAMEKVKEKGFVPQQPEAKTIAAWVGNEEMIRVLCGLG